MHSGFTPAPGASMAVSSAKGWPLVRFHGIGFIVVTGFDRAARFCSRTKLPRLARRDRSSRPALARRIGPYRWTAIRFPSSTHASVITPIEQAEAFVAATGASITYGGSRAFYRPSTDSIQLPPREAFIGTPTSTPAELYYSTLLHELVHYAEASIMPHGAGRRLQPRPPAMQCSP